MTDDKGVRRALPAVPLEPLRDRDPRSLGPYRLLGRLGAGGMGVAFLSEAGGDWSVVKVVRAELAEDRSHRARISRELEAMRRAESPFTAALLEQHLDDDPAWFAMEFIPGVTLARLVNENGPLPVTDVVELAQGLVHVLASVHDVGIVHRDLKPSNIMMSPTGPRLIDFGIAELADGTQLTRTGSVVGSAGWLAPEQITGAEVTAATDVHAWGLCVLFATTGKAPFDSATASSSLYRVLEETPSVPDSLPEPLRALVVAALSKEAARRPTLTQLVAAFTPMTPEPQVELKSQPKLQEKPLLPVTSEVPPTDQWTEETPLATVSSPERLEPRAADAPVPRSSSSRRTVGLVVVTAVIVLIAGGLFLARGGDATSAPPAVAPTGSAVASAEPASSESASSAASAEPTLQYSLWVDQKDPIPDQIVKNSLSWQVDLCSPDMEVAKAQIRDGIVLSKKEGSTWVKQPVKATTAVGDRCGKKQVHIVMDVTEDTPSDADVGKGWLDCTGYRVSVPETRNFSKTSVEMCVRARVDEPVMGTS